jgi:HD superfamily phosphodiesterase
MERNDLKLTFNKLIDYAYEHKWHLYVAKGGQRQSNVLAHSLTVADLAVSLLDYVNKANLKQNAQKRLLVAAFFHDCFKLSEHFQKSITHEGESDYKKQS